MKTIWLIQGYDSQTKIFETTIQIGQMTEKQVRALLMALVAKAGLTVDEIIGAYARKRTRIANSLLEVHRDGPNLVYICGDNPHFIVRAL